jgi:hypothetical protein
MCWWQFHGSLFRIKLQGMIFFPFRLTSVETVTLLYEYLEYPDLMRLSRVNQRLRRAILYLHTAHPKWIAKIMNYSIFNQQLERIFVPVEIGLMRARGLVTCVCTETGEVHGAVLDPHVSNLHCLFVWHQPGHVFRRKCIDKVGGGSHFCHVLLYHITLELGDEHRMNRNSPFIRNGRVWFPEDE